MFESRHGVIRSIFLRLRNADPDSRAALLVIQALRISNDLYENDVVYSLKLAKEFTCPVLNNSEFQSIPDEIVRAHVNTYAKRRLNRILRSYSLVSKSFKVGDMVQVYVKNNKWQKRMLVLIQKYSVH